jgi:hypothetical protein
MTTDNSRADALTADAVMKEARERVYRDSDDDATGNVIWFAEWICDRLAAPPVEQHPTFTAQAALAAIETFESVGENNDSREPNDEDRFILTEFIAHAFEGSPVEQHEAAPADTVANPYAHQGSIGEAWRKGFEGGRPLAAPGSAYMKAYEEGKAARAAIAQPELPVADERAAQFERYIPIHELWADAAALCHRVQQGSLSPDDFAAHIRKKIDAALANARASSPNAAGAEGATVSACTRCGATTAQACNDRGCFYLESGNGEPDLSTSSGGRAYIAEFFATRLRRHDFGQYINERLAADFACTLAQYLRDHDAASPPPAPAVAPVGLTEEQPSLTNRLTQFGWLSRALRLVADTTLFDMAKWLGITPAELSAFEFGRRALPDNFPEWAGEFFDSRGVTGTEQLLKIAAHNDGD